MARKTTADKTATALTTQSTTLVDARTLVPVAKNIITNDESAMLETLRQKTGITEQEHAMILAELQDANEG